MVASRRRLETESSLALRDAMREDLRLALDRVAFAKKLGIVPDNWQKEFLRSPSGPYPAELFSSVRQVNDECNRCLAPSTLSSRFVGALPSPYVKAKPRTLWQADPLLS